MHRILVVGEDALSCAFGQRLVAASLPHWGLAQPPIDTRGITKLVQALPRYSNQARHVQPVLCIADTDGMCAKQLLKSWLAPTFDDKLIVRLAVTEVESWLMADRIAFSAELAVPVGKLPQNPDAEADPKRLVLTLLRRSRIRQLRDETVSQNDPSKQGSGYNLHLCSFVRNYWNAGRASMHSPSLARAMRRLQELDHRIQRR